MKYTLVIGAKSNPHHSAEWLSGSIVAHSIFGQSGKTAWYCPVALIGVYHKDKEGDGQNEWLKNLFQNKMEKIGFFCDIHDGEVSWCFRIEDILTVEKMEERKEDYIDYVPFFRKEYPPFKQDTRTDNHYWFILSNLKRLKQPFGENKIIREFQRYRNEYDKRPKYLRTNVFTNNVVFAFSAPTEGSYLCEDYDYEEAYDRYLKTLFLNPTTDTKLKERIIHEFLLHTIMNDFQEKSYKMIWTERMTKHGRMDILIDRGSDLLAIEIKRDLGDEAVHQLSRYISNLNKKYPDREIRGRIVCGYASESLLAKSSEKGFEVDEFKFSIQMDKKNGPDKISGP